MVDIREGEPEPEGGKRGRLTVFPELYDLTEQQCAVYDVDDAKKVRGAVANVTRLTGRKFVTRIMEEDDGYGHSIRVFKVWRKKEKK